MRNHCIWEAKRERSRKKVLSQDDIPVRPENFKNSGKPTSVLLLQKSNVDREKSVEDNTMDSDDDCCPDLVPDPVDAGDNVKVPVTIITGHGINVHWLGITSGPEKVSRPSTCSNTHFRHRYFFLYSNVYKYAYFM